MALRIIKASNCFNPLQLLAFMRAIDGARTRGLDLGKVARYQLRHYRIYYLYQTFIILHDFIIFVNCFSKKGM